jgi:hypothetical protein
MIRAQATWAQVEVGSFILDKNDKMWKVIDSTPDGMVGLMDRAGSQTRAPRPEPARDVMMVVPTIEEAVETFRKVIGIVGIREEKDFDANL